MGQNQRRPGFLRWGEGTRPEDGEPTGVANADEQQAADHESAGALAEAAQVSSAASAAGATPPTANPAAADDEAAGETPFLRDLVDAMRGVAESSRDANLGELRQAVDKRLDELGAAAAQRAEELRRRSELDLNGIGDWERSELERVRTEAEQRREARRAQLEKELTEHQAAADREVEATRARLSEYERELETFFAQLAEIDDPAAFVATAKRMPAAPDLARPASTAPTTSGATAAVPNDAASADVEAEKLAASEETLSERLAQLDQRLATATTEAAPTSSEAVTAAATAAPAAAATTATVAPPAPATNGTEAEASTAIVVKGLGSFGAITSFKQALERVDGISGVTLSLGPTGDFVYRASHAPDFDISAAIRSIEGPAAAIEQVDGQLRVTIERPR